MNGMVMHVIICDMWKRKKINKTKIKERKENNK